MGKLDNLFGSDNIMEKVSGLDFIISPRAYFCVNTTGAEVLVRTVAEMAGLHRNMTLLDICCGSGAIGLSLASRVGNVRSDFLTLITMSQISDCLFCLQVLGVDMAADTVDDARRNALNNKISNAYFIPGPAEDMIPQMIGQASHDEIVAVLDPPRAGLHMKAIRQIRASRIKRVVFVSSDPKSCIKNFVDLARPSSTTFFGDPFLPVSLSLANTLSLYLMLSGVSPASGPVPSH